jgi:outer membrane protein assembly factor BamB
VQIYSAPVPMVHVGTFLWPRDVTKATLCRIEGETLHPIVSYDGAYTFSVSQDGLVLGRGDRSFGRKSSRTKSVDVILNPTTGVETRRNLGHFDVFNHYLRIDNAPYLFFVQGTPPDNYARKCLCSVGPGKTVRRHWPILVDDGDKPNSANYPMECSFAYLRDKAGEGIVAAGRYYTGRMECGGFFYRRDLPSGGEAWRHATQASPTAIKCVPGSDVVLAAFLDGGLWAVRSDTGKILYKEMFATGSHANVIFSFDVDTTHFYFGLLDGRYGMMPLADLGL